MLQSLGCKESDRTESHTHTLKERIPANHLTYSTIARDEICVSTHTLSTDKIHMLKLNLQ